MTTDTKICKYRYSVTLCRHPNHYDVFDPEADGRDPRESWLKHSGAMAGSWTVLVGPEPRYKTEFPSRIYFFELAQDMLMFQLRWAGEAK